MRRPADVKTLTCPCTVRERDCVDQMKQKTGFASDANLVRVALYKFAVYLDQDVDLALFRVRGCRTRRRKARAA